MPIKIIAQNSSVVLGAKLVKFSELASNFRMNWQHTGNTEEKCKKYVDGGFKVNKTEQFAREVCNWSPKSGWRVLDNLIKYNKKIGILSNVVSNIHMI